MSATTQALNSDFHVGSLSGRLGGRWGYGRLRRRPPVCVRLAKAAFGLVFFSLEACRRPGPPEYESGYSTSEINFTWAVFGKQNW